MQCPTTELRSIESNSVGTSWKKKKEELNKSDLTDCFLRVKI